MTLEHINESAENYLETILVLSERLPAVRSIDIVHELGFKKSSVSVAMKNLRESNHIVMDENGFIHLTEDACKLEHVLSKESFAAIKNHAEYFKNIK